MNIERYLGKWYEIALYPNWFEKGCFRSTAFYEKLENGQIKVTNQCRMHGTDGELNEAIGIASIVDTKSKAKLKPGMIVSINTEEGDKQVMVIKAGKFNVDVDTNHPLAGKTLTFDVDVQGVRDATGDEISHGHAHGVGGHHH